MKQRRLHRHQLQQVDAFISHLTAATGNSIHQMIVALMIGDLRTSSLVLTDTRGLRTLKRSRDDFVSL